MAGLTRILTLLPSVSRLAGGPFDSVRRLSQFVARRPGLSVSVYGVNDEYTAADRGAWAPLDLHVFHAIPPRRFGTSPSLARALLKSDADLVHGHAVWRYESIATLAWNRKTSKPYVISPRGRLDSWALRHSASKKRIAAALFENKHLRRAACIHALSPAEMASIRDYGLRVPICVIPNGVDMPESAPARNHQDRKELLFLGRVHAKKGLLPLLEAWRRARAATPTANDWVLRIVGWDDGPFGIQLRKEFADESVVWHGPAFGADKWQCYARADAFILPSFSEGLPMAVLEAWASACPSLITPACNLSDAFAADAALCIAPKTDSILGGLTRLFEMTDAERRSLGERARQLAHDKYSWECVAAAMAEVYSWLLGGGTPPETVSLASPSSTLYVSAAPHPCR